jgi:glucose repression mediator protein
MFREMDDMTWVVDIDILIQLIEMGASCNRFCYQRLQRRTIWYYLDPSNAEYWHQMGCTYMVGHGYHAAYESYQQAVNRDGQNPVCWCNIGQLYFKINQYLDALHAYSRALQLNPYGSEVWASLGELYYNGSNQAEYSLEAYSRALKLDPTNQVTRARVRQLKI